MDITYKNKTRTAEEWAEKTGISVCAIKHRIYRGWPAERTLETPVLAQFSQSSGVVKITKEEGERFLNDSVLDSLPSNLRKIIVEANRCRGVVTKYGQFLRNKHRAVFDEWFSLSFLPTHEHQTN